MLSTDEKCFLLMSGIIIRIKIDSDSKYGVYLLKVCVISFYRQTIVANAISRNEGVLMGIPPGCGQ